MLEIPYVCGRPVGEKNKDEQRDVAVTSMPSTEKGCLGGSGPCRGPMEPHARAHAQLSREVFILGWPKGLFMAV